MLPSAAGQRGKHPESAVSAAVLCVTPAAVRYSPRAAGAILPELPDNSGNPDRPVANGFGGYDYVCIGSRVNSVIQAISVAAATAMRRLSAMALGMAGPSGELAAIPPK
jgi:hypothetical protein